MGWPVKSDYKGGQALRAVSADDLNTLGNIVNEIEGVNCIIEKSANGKGWQIIINLDDTCFTVTGENQVIKTNGASGTTLNGDTVVNGLITVIGT